MTDALRLACVLLSLVAAGCATTLNDADRLSRDGQHEAALALLTDAAKRDPADGATTAALMRQRELTVMHLAQAVERHRLAARLDLAEEALARLRAVDARHPRTEAAARELARSARHAQELQQAQTAAAAGRPEAAEALLRQVLVEAPGHPAARLALQRLREREKPVEERAVLGAAFQKPVSLDFRDAPLRQVLEGLGRGQGINFVFDRDVRGDTRVTVLLKDVSIDEALRVVLTTQQLERKVLNDSTVLIYPNTSAKQREHVELVTRNFYLANADVKQAQTLVRTIAKTRDLFIDERLNLLVIRDTPEVVRLVEHLVAGLDLAEPEVMLEVEVMEVSSNRLDELGLRWPDQVAYGLPEPATTITRADRDSLRASIANPAVLATLRGTISRGNVLANPRLRARNREKAKVLIGEKLPVFTTTSTANVGVSASVTYLDVGLKLEVEPSVQLDNDVIMRVNLEVSTLIGRVAGPQGSVAYQIGTRQATTSLRLRDGETQVLAGLIRDEDTKGVDGLPVLADLPVLGRLFGVHTDQRVKNEVVLLITPRVIRNLGLPDADGTSAPAGLEASPGAPALRLRNPARMAVGLSSAPPRGAAPSPAAAAAAASEPSAPDGGVLSLSATAEAAVGATAAVTLRNRSSATVSGELVFDPQQLQPVQGEADRTGGRAAFALAPGADRVTVLRVLPAAAGQVVQVSVGGLSAQAGDGSRPAVRVEGDAAIRVKAGP